MLVASVILQAQTARTQRLTTAVELVKARLQAKHVCFGLVAEGWGDGALINWADFLEACRGIAPELNTNVVSGLTGSRHRVYSSY